MHILGDAIKDGVTCNILKAIQVPCEKTTINNQVKDIHFKMNYGGKSSSTVDLHIQNSLIIGDKEQAANSVSRKVI